MFRIPIAYLLLGLMAPNHRTLTRVTPKDPKVRYIGRFDRGDPGGPKCAWPASAVEVAFRGTEMRVRINESGEDELQVVVDGTASQVLKLTPGNATYIAVDGLNDGRHDVRLVKRTEAFVGTTQFVGFEVDGTVLAPSRPRRSIEVIGDSISCGYGLEAKSRVEHFSIDTEDAYMTYGAQAARQLDADFVDISWSGRKMWPDNTIPEVYGLAIPSDRSSTFDFGTQIPNVIVINLGTNDFGWVAPDESKWTAAYAEFIQRLRDRAPKARIYLAIGPMVSNRWPPGVEALSKLQRYLTDVVGIRARAGDDNLRILELGTHDEAIDGMGADSHPSLTTHSRMAQILVEAIRHELGWTSFSG
ncbi:MAG: SGNH/GDSL hydrolase family protein [Fimbriimonas sp.]|nr:SGNH/GDSL hydrolase family protein [Fimbriimonas sp.]